MFCPKCGKKVEDGVQVCINCGLDFATLNQKKEENEEVSPVQADVKMTSRKSNADGGSVILKIIYFGLAAVVLIMFFKAASSIAGGGSKIMQIQSVGGKTLEEAFYYELGSIYAGYAMISRALGIFFASVLIWLGLKK